MAYPLTLRGFSNREAITDTLHRALISVDRNSISHFDFAFLSTAIIQVDETITQGLDAIRVQIIDFLGSLHDEQYPR